MQRGVIFGMKSKETHVMAMVHFTAEGMLHYMQRTTGREVIFC